MMINATLIGNKIAEARKKSRFSQAELANQISISPQAVGKWERGESMPDITTLNRLALIFGLDLNYFSDDFQSVQNTENQDEMINGEPKVQLNTESKQRFDWNWDMSKGNWVDADFSGLKDLNYKFNSSNLKNCKFVQSNLSGLTLKGNAISDCDFSQANIGKGKFQASEILRTNFNECNLIDASFQQSEIRNCFFDNANLSGVEFMNSNLQKVSTQNAVFKHTSFKNTSFSEITFGGLIEDCSFENCSFKNVKFQNAVFINSFFKHNRKFNRVTFIDCEADKLSFAFFKNNGASVESISIILDKPEPI